MLIAEIRRKLASIDELEADDPESLDQLRGLLRESKEDLLTADVFGALKYLPRKPYLETVLKTLVERNPASRELRDAWPQLHAGVQNLEFRFWPSYPTPAGLSDGWTEPDVQLADERTLLLFEAKLNSAFGDRQLERELAVAATERPKRKAGDTRPETNFTLRRAAIKQLVKQLTADAKAGQSIKARSYGGAVHAKLVQAIVVPLAEISTEDKVNQVVDQLTAMVGD